jgi:hypothetical protein
MIDVLHDILFSAKCQREDGGGKEKEAEKEREKKRDTTFKSSINFCLNEYKLRLL